MLRILTVVVSLIIGSALPASAQVFVSAGAGFPMGPERISDVYDPSFGASAGIVLENTAFPYARLRPQGSYQRFVIEDSFLLDIEEAIEDSLPVDVTVSGAERGIIFAGADLQLRIPYAAFTPYVAPAAGVAFIATSAIEVEAPTTGASYEVEDDATGFALGIGAGLAGRFGDRLELFAEGHYMLAFIEGENERWFPIRFGLALSFED